MRALAAAAGILASTVLVLAVPVPETKPSDKKVPPVSSSEAANYSRTMKAVARHISENYAREIAQEKLLAAALRRLYDTAGTPLPPHLHGDLEKILVGGDADGELYKSRLALGAPPVLEGDQATRVSLEAMIELLDPFSAFHFDPSELERNAPLSRDQVGIGITLEERAGPGPLLVRTVLFKSPAQAAGILPGDQLLEINGKSTAELSAAEAMLRANQMAGSRTVIVFQRDGMAQPRREEIVCTVVREPLILGARRIPDGTWDFMLDRQHKIGLIRVGLLTSRRSDLNGGEPDTEEQIRKAIADLRESGLRGLILDLRECPGGVVQGAVQVADMFLDEKLIATLHSRGDGLAGPSERMSGAENSILDLPLVVLVGPDTSGGGELIAAALQDHGRARIAGQRTRGKASVQSPTVGIMGVYVRLTTGAFVRPSGKNLNRFADSRPSEWGVQPEEDLEVRLSAGLRRRLRAWRCQQDHQPVDPRVMLPLDDPEKDPVLYAGWQDLVKRRGQ